MLIQTLLSAKYQTFFLRLKYSGRFPRGCCWMNVKATGNEGQIQMCDGTKSSETKEIFFKTGIWCASRTKSLAFLPMDNG